MLIYLGLGLAIAWGLRRIRAVRNRTLIPIKG
jgi:hypothetical protein